MKIIHVMAGRCLGGAETYSTDVMLSLHQAGVDQMIVMSRHAPRFAELEQAGLKLAPSALAVPFRPLQRRLLDRLMRREKPDILQTWMRRAANLVPRQKAEGRYQKADSCFLIPDPCPLPSVVGWFGGYYDPRHFRRCSHIVGVTKDIVAHMVRNGVAPDRAFFIPTFPDLADAPPIDRAALTTPKDAKVLLTLSRLHPKKGLDTFLRALAVLPDCYGWLAGDGPLRGELEKLAAKLGIADRVRFLGWRTDRAALLRAADVCVLPSRYEPFGTVILEAWAARAPLVACRSAGPAAHVEDNANGLLAPIGDAEALAAALRRALGDDALRERLVAEGYAAYMKDYTREAVTRQWIGFYESLIKDRDRA
jgi:glycosyltransferase involved in cell wall biosynthesis